MAESTEEREKSHKSSMDEDTPESPTDCPTPNVFEASTDEREAKRARTEETSTCGTLEGAHGEFMSADDDAADSDRVKKAESLKKEGNEAYKERRYGAAVASYTMAMQYDPTNHILYSNRAMCRAALNQWQLVKSDAEQALKLSKNEFLKAKFHLARASLRLRDPAAARDILTEGIRKLQNDSNLSKDLQDWLSLQAEVEYVMSQRRICLGCGSRTQGDGHRLTDDGDPFCEACWDWWESEQQSKLAEAESSDLKNRGNEAFKAERYEDSISLYSEAIKLTPKNFVLFSNRCMCYGALGMWESALQDAQSAISLSNGEFAKAHFHAAKAQLRLEQLDSASKTLKHALERFEGHASHTKVLRDCETLLDEVDDALRKRDGVAAHSKADRHREKGNVKYKAQQYRSSLSDYTQAIEIAESEGVDAAKRAVYFANRAAAYLMLREPDRCEEDCRRALELDSSCGKFWQRLSAAQLAAGKLNEAIASLDEGLVQANVAHLDTLRCFRATVQELQDLWKHAEVALAEGSHFQAMRHLSDLEAKGVTASEKHALLMARCRMLQGEFIPVMNLTKEALQRNPQCVDAFVLRAEATSLTNMELLESPMYDEKLEEALRLLKRALTLDPEHEPAQQLWKRLKAASEAVLHLREKMKNREFEEAKALIDENLKTDSFNKGAVARLYEQRAKACLRLKQYEAALKDAAQATYHDHDLRDAYMTRASAYQRLGKHEETVKTYESLAQWCSEEVVMKRLWEAKFELRKSKRQDLYALLGVPSVASLPEIKKGYRERAMEWHPDKKEHLDPTLRKNTEEMFKRINEAHEILTDPIRKQWWDEGYDEEAIKERLEEMKYRQRHGKGHHFH